MKAEIMGGPGNLMRAHFQSLKCALEKFSITAHVALEILDPEKRINGHNAECIYERLTRGGVPSCVAEDVRSGIGLPPKGKVTHREPGGAGRYRRARTRAGLQWGKPEAAKAIRRSGVSRKELWEAAGIGKETLRLALYDRVGPAAAIAGTLAAVLTMPEIRKFCRYRESPFLGREPKAIL